MTSKTGIASMKQWIFGPLLCGALLAGNSFARAQGDRTFRDMDRGEGRGMMSRFSQEDMDAFTEARIAALRAGLRLSAEQEKLWPAVEDAIKNVVRQRRDQMRDWRDSRGERSDDLPATIRSMAERQAARAEALRKLADSATPLYATFDEGQKRRLRILVRGLRPHGMMRGGWHGRDSGRRSWRDGQER
jgi:zinc resistance-associated protein